MKKGIICLVVILSMIFPICGYATVDESSGKVLDTSGVVVSTDEFKEYFSGNPTTRSTLSGKSLSISKLAISNIRIAANKISLTVKIQMGQSYISLPISGKITASYKTQLNVNSAIIEVDDHINGFEVLLFEIFNDTANDNLLLHSVGVGKRLENTKHIKLYLKDKGGNIHLYETDLPSVFDDINAFQYEAADKYKDMLWALPYVEHDRKELHTDDNIRQQLGLTQQTRATSEWQYWEYPVTNYDSYYVGGDYTQHYSLPYVMYRYTNVDSGDCTWVASFKVAEHTVVSNSINSVTLYGTNCFDYYDVKLSVAAGDNTTFLRSYHQGRIYDYSSWFMFNRTIEEDDETNITLYELALSFVPNGTTITTILNYFGSLVAADYTVKFGDRYIKLYNALTVAVSSELSGYYISESTDQGNNSNVGHYYTMHLQPTSEAINSPKNTTGILLVNFILHEPDSDAVRPIANRIYLYYTVSP